MVNLVYTKKETIAQIQTLFHKKKQLPSIQLHNFFTRKEYLSLQSTLKKISLPHEKKPLLYSYSHAVIENKLITPPLQDINTIIRSIMQKPLILNSLQLLQLQQRDYTLLHDKNVQHSGYDIIFDLTEQWNHHAGGNLTYTNGQGTSFTLPITPNTLTLVHRKKSFQKYIHYINHHAGRKKRLFLIGVISELESKHSPEQKHL